MNYHYSDTIQSSPPHGRSKAPGMAGFLVAVLVALCSVRPAAGQGVFPPEFHHEIYTPLQWQPKLLLSPRDRNQNFVEDDIDAMPPTNSVNIVLDLNDCPTPTDVARYARYGKISYVGRYLTVVCLDNVTVSNAVVLAKDSQVAMVELSRQYQAMLDVSVPNIRVRASPNYSPNTVQDAFPTLTGTGVNVAIIDTGVDDGQHESLPASKFVGGYNAITDTEGNPDDDQGHGTNVAATVMGTGGPSGTYRGVAPDAHLVDIKVLDSSGFSVGNSILMGIEKCIQRRTDWNIGVANMSLGGCAASNGSDSLSQAVNRMVMAGIVAVVAMGNTPNCGDPNNLAQVNSPAAADYAISVAASDDHGQINRTLSTFATFSYTGPRLDDGDTDLSDELKPDVAAPGVNIHSAQFNTVSGYIDKSGTSQATPHVAGLAALILQQVPSMTPFAVRQLIRDTAERRGTHPLAGFPGWDSFWGWGLVDGYAALNQLATTLKTDLLFLQNTSSPDPQNWLSADLFPVDPNVSEGVPNTIQANIHNNGPNPASNFQVRIGIYAFSNGDLDYNICNVNVPGPLAAGATMTLNCPWTPSISGAPPGVVHACLKAQIVTPFDTDYSNNNAQHNVNIQQTHSPATFRMRVVNPTGTNILMTVRNDLTNNSSWKLSVAGFTNGPVTFQMAAQDCPRTLDITLTPPANLISTQAVNMRVFGSFENSDRVIPFGGVQLVAAVRASNAPPATIVDNYNYTPSQTLKVAAPGVLCNDTDPDGDQLRAVLVGSPQHGQLMLLADGSFTYTPVAGYSGSDAFTYQATDGIARSFETIVAIDPSPQLTVTPGTTNTITIGWPDPSTGFVLQSTSTLTPVFQWTDVQFTPQIMNGQKYITVTNTQNATFYRLLRKLPCS